MERRLTRTMCRSIGWLLLCTLSFAIPLGLLNPTAVEAACAVSLGERFASASNAYLGGADSPPAESTNTSLGQFGGVLSVASNYSNGGDASIIFDSNRTSSQITLDSSTLQASIGAGGNYRYGTALFQVRNFVFETTTETTVRHESAFENVVVVGTLAPNVSTYFQLIDITNTPYNFYQANSSYPALSIDETVVLPAGRCWRYHADVVIQAFHGAPSASGLSITGDASSTFTIGSAPPDVCGDGIIAIAESCDDSGTSPGDGCDATCQVETGPGLARVNLPFCSEVAAVPLLSAPGIAMLLSLLGLAGWKWRGSC